MGCSNPYCRKNVRQDRQKFNLYGATIDYIEPPLPSVLAEEMYQCLLMSAQHNDLTVPFEDLQNHKHAFFSQDQYSLVARADNRVIGFFSYFPNSGAIQQCHGGFDYDLSLKTKAYHNLMHAAVELTIHNGYDRVALGPLNNETKRRIGTHLMPMTAHLWCREQIVRFISRLLFIKNFQIYQGPAVTCHH